MVVLCIVKNGNGNGYHNRKHIPEEEVYLCCVDSYCDFGEECKWDLWENTVSDCELNIRLL